MVNTQLPQIPVSGPHPLPFLPEHHPDTPAHPFIRAQQQLFHVGQLVIVDPSGYELFQLSLPFLIARHISSAGQFLYSGTHFDLSLSVYPELEAISDFVEAISKELYLVGIGYHSLFPIHLQK